MITSAPTSASAPRPSAGSNALAGELTPAASFLVNGAAKTHITEADATGTGEITATITVTFDGRARPTTARP